MHAHIHRNKKNKHVHIEEELTKAFNSFKDFHQKNINDKFFPEKNTEKLKLLQGTTQKNKSRITSLDNLRVLIQFSRYKHLFAVF